MKTGRAAISAALVVVAGWAWPLAAPAQDATLKSPKRDGSSSLSDERKGSTPPPEFDTGSGRRRIEDTVQIISVEEGKPDADGRRKITVKLHYVLISYAKGALALGFNLKSATKFVAVTQQEVVRGTDDAELSAKIVPVKWPKDQPFKLYVGLSGEPHPKQTSLLAAVSQVMKPALPVAPRP